MKFRFLATTVAAFAFPFAAIPHAAAQAPDSAASSAAVPPSVAQAFPDIAASDLPFDTGYRVGVLNNGMRYIIRSNATPPRQGKVQLWVDFGSAAEGEDEQGFAHFIEHMAFNGSTNLPEGEMVRLLEREGLAFGADTNASTGFDTTIYQLDLPRNDPALLDTALMLMRETASEIAFDDEAVQREKGVILSERRVRDTYQLRTTIDNLGFLYPGTNFAERLPIGKAENIQAATGASLRDLYARYYRPENAALIVVGDYDADAVEAAIREHFADWQAPSRLDLPDYGPADPALAGETRIYLDPALSEEVTIARHGEWLGELETAESRRTRLLRQIGYSIVNRRLQRLSRLEDPPFRAAGLVTSDVFDEGRTTSLIVQAADGEWQRALAAAQEEYRRALAFGFSEAEVAEQVANLRAAIEASAAGAATRPNATFVNSAITLLRDAQVPTTPASALERFNAQAPAITPDAVMQALNAELVPLDNPLIRFQGRTAPAGGEAQLRAAWESGMAVELAANEQAELAEFAYQDFGTPGTVISDTLDPRLDIREVIFSNGLKLNLKRTDLQQDRVLVQLNVDGGQLLNTRDDPLAVAMVPSLPVGGLGAHTLDELQSILAGKRVDLNVAAGGETFILGANTTPRDLELQLQVMAAALSDPGFRPTGEEQYRRSVANWFAQRNATPGQAFGTSIGGIISDNDPRHSLRPEEEYLALGFAELRNDILDEWQGGALELALVGDIEEDRAVELVARTLGALPSRAVEFGEFADNRDRSFTADRSQRTVYHDGPADQAMLVMAWPTRDDSDHRASQVLDLLERVIQLELTDSLREELGQTYSPAVDAEQSRVYPGFGTFDLSASVDVDQVAATREAMLGALTEIREGPVDGDVLLRARQPILEAYDNALSSNSGWLNLVDRAQTEPERIDRFLAGKAQLESITAEELQAAAELYLDPEQRLEVMALPRP